MAKIETIDLTKLKRNVLREILDACAIIDANSKNELGTKELYRGVTTWSVPELNYNSRNTTGEELKRIVQISTQETSFRRAYAKVYELSQSNTKAPEYSEPTMTSAPKYAVDANTLTPDQLKQFQEEDLVRQGKEKQIRVKYKENVEASIKKQQELYEKTQNLLKDKEVVVVPSEEFQQVTLTSQDKRTIYNYALAAGADRETAEKLVAQKIQESVGKSSQEIQKNISPQIIKRAATDLIQKVAPYSKYQKAEDIPSKISVLNPTSSIAAITNPNSAQLKRIVSDEETRNELTQKARALAVSLVSEEVVNSSLTMPLYENSENISLLFYPEQITKFQLAEDQESQESEGRGIRLNLRDVYNQGKRVLDIWQKIANGTATADEIIYSNFSTIPAYGLPAGTSTASEAAFFISEALPASVRAIGGLEFGALEAQWITGEVSLLGSGIPETFFLPAQVGQFVELAAPAPVLVPQIGGGIAELLTTEDIAAGATFTGETVGTTLATTGTEATTALATTSAGGLAATFAALGAWGTPILMAIGAAIGWIIGKIASKINWKKVKENFPIILGVTLGIGGFFLFGPLPGVVIGVVTFVAVTAVAGGVAAVGAGIAGVAGAIGGVAISIIGIPVLIIILAFPVIVALILFIINSGAYVVPPTSSSINSLNPYIDVEKVPSPAGQIASPTTIAYTVTITAKKDILSKITFTNTCQAIKKGGVKIDCKSLEQLPTPPDSISPSQSASFSFSSAYDGGYQDALVTDNITVNATASDGTKTSETGSASVCFGKCPLDCYQTVNNGEPWPSDLKANLDAAAADLASTYPNFAAKVCSAGTVDLCYTTQNPTPEGSGGLCNGAFYARHVHTSSCDINFNQCGIKSESDAIYMLAHESTHHIQSINGSYQQKFDQQVPQSEWALCTYSSTGGNDAESMAEGDGLFVGKPSWNTCASGYGMSLYPYHYAFAKNVMFAP